MYRMPVIIGKICPDRANRTQTRSEGNCFPLKGLKFDRRRSIHYPVYYTATCQNENMTSHGAVEVILTIYLLPAFVVLISREIVRQRRWRRLATEDAGVEKPDYLRSDTKDVIIGKRSFVFLDSGQFISSIHREVVKSPCKWTERSTALRRPV